MKNTAKNESAMEDIFSFFSSDFDDVSSHV